MTGFVIPYETDQTSSRVWVAWWSKVQRPPLGLRLQNLWRKDTVTQHAFGRNANFELIHYWWWAQEGWQAENLTQYANIGDAFRIASDPVVMNLYSGTTRTQHAFARNAAGDLIHYWWWAQEGWQAENLTLYGNIGNAFRIASDPFVINLQSDGTLTQHAFARNAAGDLIHYWWWAQQGWRAENLTTQYANIGNAFRIAGDPIVVNLWSGDTPTQHAFARNAVGELVHYWWSAQESWQAENLTQYANIGNAYRIASDPVVINLRDGAMLTQQAFARNTAGDLIHYWWRAEEGWQAVNRTFTGYRIVSEPVVITLRSGDMFTQHVFARNNVGDLIHYWWWAQQGWRTENLTGYANIGADYRIAGDPVVINLQSGDAPTQHVFARNNVGDLIHYWWGAQEGWQSENLTGYANIGAGYRIASDPVVLNLQSGDTPTQHVFARNNAGDLIHYWWWAQQGWRAENLTQYPNIGNMYDLHSEPVAINHDVLREIALLNGGWSLIGLEGEGAHEAACQYQVVPLDGLEPSATYQMVLFETDTECTVTIGFVETLPDRLPSSDAEGVSQRPFTIPLGSCYYAPDDPDKKVDQAYVRLWNSPEHRPHIKILCGDQVYVDQPAGPLKMDIRMSSVELRRWMIRKYRESWINLTV